VLCFVLSSRDCLPQLVLHAGLSQTGDLTDDSDTRSTRDESDDETDDRSDSSSAGYTKKPKPKPSASSGKEAKSDVSLVIVVACGDVEHEF
jgi:hypothetical protein